VHLGQDLIRESLSNPARGRGRRSMAGSL
jgi:hypothetical protein